MGKVRAQQGFFTVERTCPTCGGRWQPGDLIRSHVDTPGQSGYWAHDSCPDDDPLEATHPVCQGPL